MQARRDTIFATATAPGRAGVAMVRLSGPGSFAALCALLGSDPPPPRRAALRTLRNPADGEPIDHALVLCFPAPASMTGEDVAELQVHGSRAVLAELLAVLAALPGLRLAEPGEFTRRAFLNGRMDLTAAEGLADVIDAETAAQKRQALQLLEGKLALRVERLRAGLVRAMAHLEAYIDFPDEEIPSDVLAVLRAQVAAARGELAAFLADGGCGERIREGVQVVLLGAPNAGKSTLLNALAGREAAIVSHIAGTTRDVVEVRMDMGGYAVTLADTAGLRAQAEEIEAEGIRRALCRAGQADIKIVLFDGGALPRLDDDSLPLVDEKSLVLISKADALRGAAPSLIAGQPALPVSVLCQEGMEAFMAALTGRIAALCGAGRPDAMITRARHRQALERALLALERFAGLQAVELMAEELRQAAREVGKITGAIDVEMILDELFASFCIGK